MTNDVVNENGKSVGLGRFHIQDVGLLENMVLNMELRMTERYDKTVTNLNSRLGEALTNQDEIEKSIKDLSDRVRKICAALKLEPPKPLTFEVTSQGQKYPDSASASSSSHGLSSNVATTIVTGSPKTPEDQAPNFGTAVTTTSGVSDPADLPQSPVSPGSTVVSDVVDYGLSPILEDPLDNSAVDTEAVQNCVQEEPGTGTVAAGAKGDSVGSADGQKQIVMMKGKHETVGIELDEPAYRIFQCHFDLTCRGEKHKILFSLVRHIRQKKPMELFVCFPYNPRSSSSSSSHGDPKDTFFGNFTLKYQTLDKNNEPAFSDSFDFKAGDGKCLMEGLTPEKHLECTDASWTNEIVDPIALKRIDDECVQLKIFKSKDRQAFFINVSMELIPLDPDVVIIDPYDPEDEDNDASFIATEADGTTWEDSSAATEAPPTFVQAPPTIAAPPPSEKYTEKDFRLDINDASEIGSDMGLEAFLAWQKNPSASHAWYTEVGLNMELLLFAHEKILTKLAEQIVKNLMAIPDKYFESDQVQFIQDITELMEDDSMSQICLELRKRCEELLTLHTWTE